MISTIVNYIKSFALMIWHTLEGLGKLISFVFTSQTALFTVFGYLPAIISIACTLTIIVLIIKLVIGRDN